MSSDIHNQNEPLLPAKPANEDNAMSPMSNVAVKVLAVLRIGFGATCLVAPRFACGLFRMDVPAAYTVLPRLFGGRDLVLGELLWTAGDKKLPGSGRHEVKRALWAGIGTDMLDIGSFLFGLASGTVSKAPAMLVTGAAITFITLGAVGIHGV